MIPYEITMKYEFRYVVIFQTVVLSHPAAMKALSPGRIVIVSDSKHRNVLGVVLQVSSGLSGEKKFTVLVIGENNANNSAQTVPQSVASETKTQCASAELSTQYVDSDGPEPVLLTQLFVPDGPSTQTLLALLPRDINVITTKTIKVEPEKIVNDIKKRQQARFKYVKLACLKYVRHNCHPFLSSKM